MRGYGKVHTSFWSSETIRSMSEDARALALYLMTSPHTTIAGVFRLPDGYAVEDLQWAAERVSKGFDELLSKGFANRCETTKWVWICKHLKWNAPENPNQRTAARKCANQIPDECAWKPDFYRVCAESIGAENPNPSRTAKKGSRNQKQEQEQKQKKEKDLSAGDGLVGFSEFWAVWPNKKAKRDAEAAWAKIRPDAGLLAAILAAIATQVKSDDWTKDAGRFIPHPATWLNGRRWEDEALPTAAAPGAVVDYDPLAAAQQRKFGQSA